jgi:multiple sugar transport system permease protein
MTASPVSGTAPRRRRPGATHQARWAWLFLAPVVVTILVLRVAPTVQAFGSSLLGGIPSPLKPQTFAGLQNYLDIFADPNFDATLLRTVVFNLIINPLQIGLALLVAVLMTRRIAARSVWRILMFIPAAIPIVGSAIAWGVGLAPNGPLNGFLNAIGLPTQLFLGSASQALPSIIIICSWIGIGYWMLFLIAGLDDIPAEYYEAARLDRAGPVRTFFSITLPLLRRPLLFVLVADTVGNFVVFAPIQLLTLGGPQNSTNVLMYDAYTTTYQYSDPSTGAAKVVVLTLVMLVFVLIQFRLLREER